MLSPSPAIQSLFRPLKLAAFSVALAFATATPAQTYPAKPIRLLVGFAAGASVDLTGRYYAERVGKRLAQTVLVENRPGAAAQIAMRQLVDAAPDGYTIMVMSAGTSIASARINPPFDVRRDMRPVAALVAGPLVFYVHPSLPVKNLAEWIAYAKARPGQLNYTSAGIGSLQNLIFEFFNQRTGIKVEQVPFKGANESVMAVVAGQVQIGMDTLAPIRGQAEAGKVRLIALTSARSFQGVPGTVEAGLAGFDFTSWSGIGAPVATPRNLVDALNSAFNAVSNDPESVAHFAKQNQYPISGTPEDYGRLLASETEIWSKLIRALNIQFD